mmetsp:Transcript_34570/g.97493  ORF Transcript_34570/g.97493 Transcript_34570/m.97493 type:complete len:246 (+) Transcript_34570:15-752(+)
MKVSDEYLRQIIKGQSQASSQITKQTPRGTGVGGGESAGGLPDQTNLFEALYAKDNIERLKTQFESLSAPQGYMTENQFLSFMRNLTDFRDHEIIEIFDFVDTNSTGGVGFNEYFLIVSMMSSRTSAQTTHFLYLHGREVFDMILDPTAQQSKLTFERFSRLGFIMGLSETQIVASLKDFDFDVFSFISFDEFMMYYFVVLDDFDSGRSPSDALNSEVKVQVGGSAANAKLVGGKGNKDEKCLVM